MILRKASSKDCTLYFDWVNEEEVRKNSISSNDIIWEEHIKWFTNRIECETSALYVLEKGEQAVGQIRLDIIANQKALIDYSIDKKFRGKGYGKKIVMLVIEKARKMNIEELIAEVKLSNITSINIFRSLGFVEKKNNTLQTYSLVL